MSEPWYTVKCLFHHPTRAAPGEARLFEERITLWRATSFEEAHSLAEADAKRYAAEAKCEFVGSTDSFHLFDEDVVSGIEVYSIMRGSNLDPVSYKRTFCLTPLDRAKSLTNEDSDGPA